MNNTTKMANTYPATSPIRLIKPSYSCTGCLSSTFFERPTLQALRHFGQRNLPRPCVSADFASTLTHGVFVARSLQQALMYKYTGSPLRVGTVFLIGRFMVKSPPLNGS